MGMDRHAGEDDQYTKHKRLAQKTPYSGARTSFWVMCIISSIAARSLGNGNLFVTSSRRVMPVDHTSDRMVYSTPDRRSGYIRSRSVSNGSLLMPLSSHKPTHRHVQARPSERPSHGVDQLARNAKIAQLDDALAGEKDVRRFDIAVDGLA